MFLIPQQSASFRYSGARYFDRRTEGKGYDFQQLTGWTMDGGCGIDTASHREDWKDTNILCEIACFDFAEDRRRKAAERERLAAAAPVVCHPLQPAQQLAFL